MFIPLYFMAVVFLTGATEYRRAPPPASRRHPSSRKPAQQRGLAVRRNASDPVREASPGRAVPVV